MVSFKIQSKQLLEALRPAKIAVGKLSKRTITILVEITIINGEVTFAVPGAVFSTLCETQGTCKATLSFWHFAQIVNDTIAEEIDVYITDGAININSTSLFARTTFFETDKILRTIILPIKYTDIDILRLKFEGYTEEELAFNKMRYQILIAEKNLDVNINASLKKLKVYGITYNDLEKLVLDNIHSNKLFKNSNS
jgi:hypothetical protein